MSHLVRICPNCETHRPPTEVFCKGDFRGALCNWDLSAVQVTTPDAQQTPATTQSTCVNGHPIGGGDLLCPTCGAGLAAPTTPPAEAPPDALTQTAIDGWQVLQRAGAGTVPFERFVVQRSDSDRRALLTLYSPGNEPDASLLEMLRRQPLDHVPELLAVGRWEGRAFEVTEQIAGGPLRDHAPSDAEPGHLRRITDEIARALASFAEIGLRHRDLSPDTILVRRADPLDLVITSFGSARLSDFDLDVASPLELTRYSAPETIVGGVSAASDWWSLGMILLERFTRGTCFLGVNEKAFLIHVVTRGVMVPATAEPSIANLLRGLLTRDPVRRWQWPQVRAWLAGENVEAAAEPAADDSAGAGPGIELGGRTFHQPTAYALAAADGDNWDAARALFLRGSVGQWLDEARAATTIIAEVRRSQAIEGLSEDHRHALALMAMNPGLPVTVRGEIVSPAWLLKNLVEGFALVSGPLPENLRQIKRELWLHALKERSQKVLEKAKLLEIEIDDEAFKVVSLATSRANLDAEWAARRRLFPDTTHAGIASLMERKRVDDEDIVLLLSASLGQFDPIDPIVEKAGELARSLGVADFSAEVARAHVEGPRRELYRSVDERVAGFGRCGIAAIDDWADSFRVERRLPLPKALTLLAVPAKSWQAPPRQQYVQKLLQFFEKRAATVGHQGPLVRLLLGKATPRVDVTELGGPHLSAPSLLERIIDRTGLPASISADVLLSEPSRELRLRRLVSHGASYRRDTGIDGVYLGFPFLIFKDARPGSTAKVPRIAPVLLWPVSIQMEPGIHAAVKISFDKEREAVRLNPTFDNLLASLPEADRWRDALKGLLEQPSINARRVVESFAHLAVPREFTLSKLPGKDYVVATGTRELVCAAALFHAEFAGQAISEDLRSLQGRPPKGTALETALMVSGPAPVAVEPPYAKEVDRFFAAETDPSQESATIKARSSPGLLIEGPPGTGKSQTILNIVGDCIGRGETVLVVCQKLPALAVVAKRLHAEKLTDRFFFVTHENTDREPTLRSLRDQLQAVLASAAPEVRGHRQQREALASRIEAVQGELDAYHRALYDLDDATGLSYRGLLGELIGMEQTDEFIDAPDLRPMLGGLDPAAISALEEECGPLAPLWLAARYEHSPLSALKQFGSDPPIVAAFHRDFHAFARVEAVRMTVIERTPNAVHIDDAAPHRAWNEEHSTPLRTLTTQQRQNLAAWYQLFGERDRRPSPGLAAIETLENLLSKLDELDKSQHDERLFDDLAALGEAALREHHAMAANAAAASWFPIWLNPARLAKRRRVRRFLAGIGQAGIPAQVVRLRDATGLEIGLRPLRKALLTLARTLRPKIKQDSTLSLIETISAADELLAALRSTRASAAAVAACPRRSDAEAAIAAATAQAFEQFETTYRESFERHAAKQASLGALSALARWFDNAWTSARSLEISSDRSSEDSMHQLEGSFPSLPAFQEFRVRVEGLSPSAVAVFDLLRTQQQWLDSIEPGGLPTVTARIIAREARLAWRFRAEQRQPKLLIQREEIERKAKSLKDLDAEMRSLNRTMLAGQFDRAKVAAPAAWHPVTLLRGHNKKSLRDAFASGCDLGLLHLRPVWLMNPDVASKLLPLKAGLFDVVIFDEASQMPVEHALPSLYRGKRVVISGDEKQMPPSTFFVSRIESDEENPDGDDIEDSASDAEKADFADAWQRREIKDCPDLLTLGKAVLPAAMLDIHYRSQYRELIAFSNGAYYQGKLNVPVLLPDEMVNQFRPIELVRVNGVYAQQTNEAEAKKVVEVLCQIWTRPPATRPSVGVVTFNRKQADLIEELVEAHAERDAAFRAALREEMARQQNGEDMSFFVKNVENVQGDERDQIVFSSTFGRDGAGAFRKVFGVLGQTGGERRLNVAITRARQKIVLVTSLPVGEISDMLGTGRLPHKARDYLQAYFDYAGKVSDGELPSARQSADRLSAQATSVDEGGAPGTDGLVGSVASFISEMGLIPVGVSQSDAFGLDLAIKHPVTGQYGIGIECDAPSHPFLAKARYREIWRPGLLRRAIPQIHRVTSRAWYQQRQLEQTRLRAAIQAALA